ncbi:sister chromatid cohesion 1 protein 4 isoform X2 [Diospyros lotus]|uniref:sister chromatid cohesion 1 protein 4 isoform X2 n=1 Tax=Diospyros lotus TaxID=55363 RepID=UPI00225B1BA8|nr:sister chromatid cohesion 1 protein 4 isoform X2 [Diospyros lotus]
MFYSQFILAKKGPLGTIWIAAHLERKLRKNQVADTDIGVSVDSILFPDVPIALRLSSHLLLGVVRIYSRKVNYLFDDCSEALLKIKQAFRSTAVDLPPEESTAPYHSITLPETFDLDDFELPDSDIFHGNYVDHHVSTREQITLQDSVEGVVYSTTQFGLDERFGDGDASGLDLDEDLFLSKVTASGPAGDMMMASDVDPHASVQSMIPLEQDENHEGISRNSEMMVPTCGENQLEGHTEKIDAVEYAQAPCTPGLLEEPNLSKTQEASVCDDQLELGEEPNLSSIQEDLSCDDHEESQNLNITKFAAKENLENITSSSDHNCGNKSLPNDVNHATILGDQMINQLKSPGDSPSTAGNPVSAKPDNDSSPAQFSDRNLTSFDAANSSEKLENGLVCSDDHGIHCLDGAHAGSIESEGARLVETSSHPGFSREACSLEDAFGNSFACTDTMHEKSGLSSTCQTVSGSFADNGENAENTLNTYPLCNSVVSNRQDLENPETQADQDQKDSEGNPIFHEKLEAENMHVLQPCNHLNQSSMSNLGHEESVAAHLPSGVNGLCSVESSEKEATLAPGAPTDVQGCLATDSVKPVLEENPTAETALPELIQEDFSKSNDPVENVTLQDPELEKVDGSANVDFPAPEKLLSAPERLNYLRDNVLVESTPEKSHLMTRDVGDAGLNHISGKKRSYTESTLTVQSLYSLESMDVVSSKRSKESVPDDDDLLSSILVGRSSVLKMKPTPQPPSQIMQVRRPRSTTRTSASKRKVLMDDTMVLHGDVIRQQLTNTEDIRRVRKKAPCTRTEIWMMRKEFLEDEIFSEPIFTGLALLHSETHDLSEIKVSQHDTHNTFQEDAADLNLVSQKDKFDLLGASNNMVLSMEPNVHKGTGMEDISDSVVVRSDLVVDTAENAHSTGHDLQSRGNESEVQIDSVSDALEPQVSRHEHSGEIDESEIDGASGSGVDTVCPAISVVVEPAISTEPVLVDNNNMQSSSTVLSVVLDEKSGGDASGEIGAPYASPDKRLTLQPVELEISDPNKAGENDGCTTTVGGVELNSKDESLLQQTEGAFSVETEVVVQASCYAHSEDTNHSIPISSEIDGSNNQVLITPDQAMEEIRENEGGAGMVDEVLAAELGYTGKDTTLYVSIEEPKLGSSYPLELDVDVRNASLDDGSYAGCLEDDPQFMTTEEIATFDQAAIEDHGEFDYRMDGHDTGFLNADDDDAAEEAEDYLASADKTSFLENSGWSSRTRAVAKYLQVLFDNEAQQSRKVIPMDNLLLGKTRKEASRMFFEALVLKTKDYIHVEQESPFNNITIKPRVKLMKSDL